MSTATVRPPQAISGVSPGHEAELCTIYPSISAGGFGQLLGNICESIPVRIWGVKLSNLLFGLPVAGLALLPYVLTKIGGTKYVLTNRSLQIWKMIGQQMVADVDLNKIADVVVDQKSGQVFYKAADLLVQAADGSTLVKLSAVPRGDIFRRTILEARDARMSVAKSLATIQARK